MTSMPNVDSSLLIAHTEYATWALGRAFALIDTLPPEAIAQPPAKLRIRCASGNPLRRR